MHSTVPLDDVAQITLLGNQVACKWNIITVVLHTVAKIQWHTPALAIQSPCVDSMLGIVVMN